MRMRVWRWFVRAWCNRPTAPLVEPPPGLPEGTYYYHITATDEQGNTVPVTFQPTGPVTSLRWPVRLADTPLPRE